MDPLTTTNHIPGAAAAWGQRFRLRGLVLGLGQAVLISAALYVFLQGWSRALKVPFGFWIDSLFYLMQAKSTIDNGWWWFNPLIGAPLGLDELAFPANGNVDQAIVWIVSRFVGDPLTAINLAWIAMLILSGLAATWCMRRLNLSTASALVLGTLFAVSPYALYRNLAHFGMAIYLVPFVCVAALHLASANLPSRGFLKGQGLVILAGSALLAFNYVYYPFFASFLLAVAVVVGFLTYRDRRILRAGALVLTVVLGCTLLNLAPSLYSWHRNGKPIILVDKVPAHAEIYGLKIRTLISPNFEHDFPPFRWWVQKETAAQFPLETENTISRLGLVASVGFLLLLGLALVPTAAGTQRFGSLLRGASQLTLAALLLATVGGFGSLFNLLVSPDIRGYNRICPFMLFFALVAVGLVIDALCKTRRQRVAVAIIVLAIGLADQRSAAVGLNMNYPSIASELRPLKRFVGDLERQLPPGAMVFQLPLRTYLNDSGVAKLQPYEHFKPYLVSRSLRWSYPALSNAQVSWQEAASRLEPARLPYQMVREGFAAIVVDRHGYDDGGAGIVAAIRTASPEPPIVVQSDRYVAIDIRGLAQSPEAARAALPTRLEPSTAGIPACGPQPVISIDQIGDTRAPFGTSPIRLRRSKAVKVSGWAIDQQRTAAAAGVDIAVDDALFPTFFGADRPDVATFYGNAVYRRSGFTGEIPPSTLTPGAHQVSLRVISSNRDCYYQGPGVAIQVD